ncbi:hypothetical protein BAMA_05800 [Bacillus manliponensis]|uniref:PepSY domain-containing protein n=1 Tax=Bacillus manliponensis TaxID=574376 RepID=A0A073JVH2_9BACI|nr:PepSY domain-containing protein [Bacillus manliponensis]KEK18295.1 hypothetical protein BAMA_05800 [Bacillus manliponensis]
MKKGWIIAIAIFITVVCAGFGTQHIMANQNNEQLTKEEVKEIVHKQYKGTFQSIKLVGKDDKKVYEIIMETKQGTYKVVVDAYSGEIINLKEIERKKEKKITEEKAKEIALAEVAGTFKTIKLEDREGTAVYIVEIETEPGIVTVVEVEAKKGAIIGQYVNTEHEPEQPPQTVITEQQAKDIAVQSVPGAAVSYVSTAETNTGLAYKVTLQHGTQQIDVLVHSITGEVVAKTTISTGDDDDDDNETNQPASGGQNQQNNNQPSQQPSHNNGSNQQNNNNQPSTPPPSQGQQDDDDDGGDDQDDSGDDDGDDD